MRTINEPRCENSRDTQGDESIEETENARSGYRICKMKKNGFKFYMSGEEYGTLYRDTESDRIHGPL